MSEGDEISRGKLNFFIPETKFLYHTLNVYSILLHSTIQSKSAVSATIKHNRYFHSTPNFRSIHVHGKRLYGHMFDMVNTAFRY